ncbi:MAG: class I SAM-dependent methyltransferase [Lewinellaceae bacterium]|nr:class I SAM-dependent methyltransferase [Saprospiraceae bacterium]MCB9340620.1 class I SAM-dependent methyltransferase [Lewinellaceae bacterium]
MPLNDADIYDHLYSYKDYMREAAVVKSWLDHHAPLCKSVLDVGCGTGSHHSYLGRDYQVDGLDINENFLAAARLKNPNGNYYTGDMANFDLGKKYDAILSLFSAIGYANTSQKLQAAFRCFHGHLHENGILITEPWMEPEKWQDGTLHQLTYENDDLKICRMNRSRSKAGSSVLHFHYLVGSTEEGIRYFEEVHELGLFSHEQMVAAFDKAGFTVVFEKEGLTGRGIYIGSKK